MAIIIIHKKRAAKFSGKLETLNSAKAFTKPKTKMTAINFTCLAGPL